MTDKEDDTCKLTGDDNYLGWLRLVNGRLAEKDCLEIVLASLMVRNISA
jgi:hypothetical protein